MKEVVGYADPEKNFWRREIQNDIIFRYNIKGNQKNIE